MRGLMGERLLNRFLRGIRRKPKFASANETEPKPESEAETTDRSNDLEADPFQGKEEEERIKKKNDAKDGLDMISDATQTLDDLQKTK